MFVYAYVIYSKLFIMSWNVSFCFSNAHVYTDKFSAKKSIRYLSIRRLKPWCTRMNELLLSTNSSIGPTGVFYSNKGRRSLSSNGKTNTVLCHLNHWTNNLKAAMASENSLKKKIEGSGKPSASSKKILPPTPVIEMPNAPLTVLDRNANSKNQAYHAFFLEYSLISEYLLLQKQYLSGVYVIPSAGSPLKWFGVIFMRQGLYQGGVFRFTLYVPDNYPDCDCPILVFDPPIFNPLVNLETGELDVRRAFPKWRRNVNHLWQVIQFAKRIFYKIETETPLNLEAAELYEKDLELYKVKAAESISVCNERLYEKPNTDDPHAFHFTPWDSSIHEDFRKKFLSFKKEQDGSKNSQNGLSWMQPGTQQIFSKTLS